MDKLTRISVSEKDLVELQEGLYHVWESSLMGIEIGTMLMCTCRARLSKVALGRVGVP